MRLFRPRDKEKYRLRRTIKKDDMESYRRMKQLRQEFSKAQMIFRLVLEREKLKQVRI